MSATKFILFVALDTAGNRAIGLSREDAIARLKATPGWPVTVIPTQPLAAFEIAAFVDALDDGAGDLARQLRELSIGDTKDPVRVAGEKAGARARKHATEEELAAWKAIEEGPPAPLDSLPFPAEALAAAESYGTEGRARYLGGWDDAFHFGDAGEHDDGAPSALSVEDFGCDAHAAAK